MKKNLARICRRSFALAVVLCLNNQRLLAIDPPPQLKCNGVPACELAQAAFNAYIYGYPLVLLQMTKDVMTNVPKPSGTRAPINQFAFGSIPDASETDVVLPSVSTPYTLAFLDLSQGPIIMNVPDTGGRFFVYEVLDAWTTTGGNNDCCREGCTQFCALGSRYNTQPGNYAFVREGWQGTLPPGIKQAITLSTDTAWIVGRILTTGTPEDLQALAALQAQQTLTPLQHYDKNWSPPTHSAVNPQIDMKTPPRDQVEAMDAPTFFRKMAGWMVANPPLPEDQDQVNQMAIMGLVPGIPFNFNTLSPQSQTIVAGAYKLAREWVKLNAFKVHLTSTFWSMGLDYGVWGTNYLERAAIAYGGLGANLYKDAIYAGSLQDQSGRLLNGDNRYLLHFDKDAMPPSNLNAFWSVTLYNHPNENLFNGPIPRNGVGDHETQGNRVIYNPDGSLDIYIQPNAPSTDTSSKEYHNWLPSPPGGGFLLLLRIYWPDSGKFASGWVPPAIEKQ